MTDAWEDEITGEVIYPKPPEPWWYRAGALVVAMIAGAFAFGLAVGGGCG